MKTGQQVGAGGAVLFDEIRAYVDHDPAEGRIGGVDGLMDLIGRK